MTDELKKELDKKIRKGIRNIRISPLFEKDKRYNIDKKSENYEKEDSEGHLVPSCNHCWLTWESHFINDEDDFWSKEASNFHTIEQAEEAETYIKSINKLNNKYVK